MRHLAPRVAGMRETPTMVYMFVIHVSMDFKIHDPEGLGGHAHPCGGTRQGRTVAPATTAGGATGEHPHHPPGRQRRYACSHRLRLLLARCGSRTFGLEHVGARALAPAFVVGLRG